MAVYKEKESNSKVKLKHALTKQADVLIAEIERLMKEDGVGNVLIKEELKRQKKQNGADNGKRIGRTQFQSLMKNAAKAVSINELILFVGYQESKENGWETKCTNNKTVAVNVTESLRKMADKVIETITISEPGLLAGFDQEEYRKLKLLIAEKYLGYLYWHATVVMKRKEV